MCYSIAQHKWKLLLNFYQLIKRWKQIVAAEVYYVNLRNMKWEVNGVLTLAYSASAEGYKSRAYGKELFANR